MTRNSDRNALILREARRFAAEVKKIFGDDLVRAFLFGSCATGTNHADSDIDVALIFSKNGISSFSSVGDEKSYACDRLELEMYRRLGAPVHLLIWDVERLDTERRFRTGFAKNLDGKSVELV